jgi:hypothetical protein
LNRAGFKTKNIFPSGKNKPVLVLLHQGGFLLGMKLTQFPKVARKGAISMSEI